MKTLRMSKDQLAAHQNRIAGHKGKPSKYRNIKVDVDGKTIDSKYEAKKLREFRLQQRNGDILWFAHQVEIQLLSDAKMVVDFLWCGHDGILHWQDAKGKVTRDWRLKQKMARELHHIYVETI